MYNTKKNYYMKVLGVKENNFTKTELKSCYRNKAFEFHPDQNPSEPEEKMKEINVAYDYLQDYVSEEFEIEKEVSIEEEKDIFKLWNECKECKGRGYFIKELPELESCPDCIKDVSFKEWMFSFLYGGKDNVKGQGYHFKDCPNCKGKGIQNLNCNRCNGTGRIKVVCSTCNGKGIKINKEKILKVKCNTCHGKGKVEIKPFNPVIRKGAILL